MKRSAASDDICHIINVSRPAFEDEHARVHSFAGKDQRICACIAQRCRQSSGIFCFAAVRHPPGHLVECQAARSCKDIRCEPVAREALIFYVRDDSRAEGEYPPFTSDEIRTAFTSEESDWQAFALEHGNGSTMCYEEFAQDSSWSLDVSNKTMLYPDMVSIIAGAALTDRSIGFAFHQFYQHNCSSPAMVFAEVDGVYPTWDTIRSGAYPVMFDMCVLYDADGPYAEAAEELIAWLRSDEGQNLVSDLGLCPLGA